MVQVGTNYQKAISKLLILLVVSTTCWADNGKDYHIGRPHVSNFKNDKAVKTQDLYNVEDGFNQYTFGVEWNATTGQANYSDPKNITQPDMFQFGIDLAINVDLALGYRAMFFWMFKKGHDWLVINPQIFAEVATHNYIGIKLGVLEIYFHLDGLGYKATPVEYQATWNLNKPAEYCHTMGFLQETFDIAIRGELYVNECFFGPFGFLAQPSNPLDCWRRRYYPNLPIWKLDGWPEWNLWIEYFPWMCNYEGGDVIKNPNGREPTNVDDGTLPEEKKGENQFEEPSNIGGDDDPISEFKSPLQPSAKPAHFIVQN